MFKNVSKFRKIFIICCSIAFLVIAIISMRLFLWPETQKSITPPPSEIEETTLETTPTEPEKTDVSESKTYGNEVGVWGRKPVLQYLLFDSTISKELEEDLSLTETQVQRIENVVRMEAESLHLLYQKSQDIVEEDTSLSEEEKREKLKNIRYNEKVTEIAEISKKEIKNILSSRQYSRFVEWIEEKWVQERNMHGRVSHQYSEGNQ